MPAVHILLPALVAIVLRLLFSSCPTSESLSVSSLNATSFDSATQINEIANHTNKVVDAAEDVYFTDLNYDYLSTKDLTLNNDTKELINNIRKSFKDVVDLDPDTNLSTCKSLLHSVEVCANWQTFPKIALPHPSAAHSVLETANLRLNHCIEALDRASHRHVVLEQLAHTIVDEAYYTQWFATHSPPVVVSSPSISQEELSRQAKEPHKRRVRTKTCKVFMDIQVWSVEAGSIGAQTVPEVFANARRALRDCSEHLAWLTGEGKHCLAGQLPELSKFCREMRRNVLHRV
jgi:hypothetical protein